MRRRMSALQVMNAMMCIWPPQIGNNSGKTSSILVSADSRCSPRGLGQRGHCRPVSGGWQRQSSLKTPALNFDSQIFCNHSFRGAGPVLWRTCRWVGSRIVGAVVSWRKTASMTRATSWACTSTGVSTDVMAGSKARAKPESL